MPKILEQATKLKESKAKLYIQFTCFPGTSYAYSPPGEVPFIHIYENVGEKHSAMRDDPIGDTRFNFVVLLHEIGHTFGLLDTYPPHDAGQPASIMSCSLAGDTLGEDDIKGVQWLYRYIHARDTLPKEKPLFFP